MISNNFIFVWCGMIGLDRRMLWEVLIKCKSKHLRLFPAVLNMIGLDGYIIP